MVRISDCSSKPIRILSYTLIIAGAAVLAMFIIPLFSGTLNTGSYFGFVIGGVILSISFANTAPHSYSLSVRFGSFIRPVL